MNHPLHEAARALPPVPSVAELIRQRALKPVFQPIASMKDGAIYAHEALIRGPRGTPLYTPQALFAAARKEGVLEELEVACVAAALDKWGELRQTGRLFVNLSAAALLATVRNSPPGAILESIKARGLQPDRLVVELTEHDRVDEIEALVEVVRGMHEAGVMLALDDFGNGASSLRLWSELEPDIVKIDMYFTRELAQRSKKFQTMRALLEVARVFGSTLVAEGIEAAEDLRVIRELGLDLGQGYLLGVPRELPCDGIEEAAASVFANPREFASAREGRVAGSDRTPALQPIIAPTVPPSATCAQLCGVFDAHPELPAIAIVDRGIPLGLVERSGFMELASRRPSNDLFAGRSCLSFADTSPRMVEQRWSPAEPIGLAAPRESLPAGVGVILTDNGRYVGLAIEAHAG